MDPVPHAPTDGRVRRWRYVAAAGAVCRTRGSTIAIDGDGGFRLDVPTRGGRLRAEVEVPRPVTAATLLTDTPEGGWNVTVKAAGGVASGWVRIGDAPAAQLGDDAGAWSDWTALPLVPLGCRRAHEQLLVLTSSYVQPFGGWRGTLPDPGGVPTTVALAGVAEDHLAVW